MFKQPDKSALNIYINSLFDINNSCQLIKKSTPFKQIEKFFSIYDWIDTTNYYRNIEELQVAFSPFLQKNEKGNYDILENKISYQKQEDILHELFHVSSTSRDGLKIIGGFSQFSGKNTAFDEGVTEFFTILAYQPTTYYPIETLIAELLSYTYGLKIYKFYFNSNYNSFIKQFSNFKPIEDIIIKLDDFQKLYKDYFGNPNCNKELTNKRLELAIKDILKNIINIVYTNEREKEKNKLSNFKDDLYNMLKNRNILNGYIVSFNVEEYMLNVLTALIDNNSKRSR